jgi:hypothetical protein
MARNSNGPLGDLPDITDPSAVVDDLEPEIVQGPLGVPLAKPKGAPDLPGTK